MRHLFGSVILFVFALFQNNFFAKFQLHVSMLPTEVRLLLSYLILVIPDDYWVVVSSDMMYGIGGCTKNLVNIAGKFKCKRMRMF